MTGIKVLAHRATWAWAALLVASIGLAACGGGGSDEPLDASSSQALEADLDVGDTTVAPTSDATSDAASDATTPGAVTAPHPTMQNITLEWAFTGDANANARVNVKYRVKGSTSWSTGMPLRRINSGSTGGYTWLTRHSGSVFNLQPATPYQIQLALVDPDGGSVTRKINVTTRTVPTPMAAAPVKRATPGTLASVINGAQPGDIIELAAGSYGNINWTTNGTAGKPIVLRQSSAGGAVITGEIYMYQRQHVMLDGLTLTGRIRFNASNFISITRCRITARNDIGTGIGIVAYLNSQDATIADNVITGPTVWEEDSLSDTGNNLGDGIALTGPGHVVMNNRISGFRDDISLLDFEEAAQQYSIDILNNDLSVAGDDAIEADFCVHNCRIMNNRITNVFVALSAQPSLGGPTYFIRNVIYNAAFLAFKLNNTSIGNLLIHNTVVKNGDAMAMYPGTPIVSLYSRNNLVIGGPGGNWGGYASGPGRPLDIWDLDVPTADMNHDALGSTLGTFSGRFGHTPYASLAQLKSISTEKNAVQIDLSVFQNAIAFPLAAMTTFAPPDLRLSSSSAAKDTGEVLPNLSDGFSGAAPDAGAYEIGAALPVYGPR